MIYKILWTDTIQAEIKEIVLSLLPDGFELETLEKNSLEEAKLKIKNSDFLLVSGPLRIDETLIKHADRLVLIQKIGVGYETLDLEAIKKHSLKITVTRNVNSISVAELTFLLILSLYRQLLFLDNRVRNGYWDKWPVRLKSYELFGKTLGIIGLGSIGKEVALRASSFGCRTVYFSRAPLPKKEEKKYKATYSNLNKLLTDSDIISLHCPYNRFTEKMIGREQLDLMKESAILINTSRGNIVDEEALCRALKSGNIAGAGLDVFAKEPPEIKNPLLTLSNVCLTPHVGGATIETFKRTISKAFENIVKVSKNQRPNEEDIINL